MYTLFIDFFINGSYYHFWYFIALFISIILVTICYKMKMQNIFFYGTIILYVIGLLGCSYYAVGNHIPVVNYIINLAGFEWFRKMFFMGVPFFSLGYFIKRYLEKDNGRTMKIYQIVLVIGVFLAEIIVVNQLGWVKNIVITISLYMLVGCVMIFLIQHPMEEARKYGKSFRMLANWTYYVHPLVIMLIKVFIGDINTVGLFLVTCMISLVSGFILINVGGWFKRILLE